MASVSDDLRTRLRDRRPRNYPQILYDYNYDAILAKQIQLNEAKKDQTVGQVFDQQKIQDIVIKQPPQQKETPYMRIEINTNTIDGHPITEMEYKKLLK